MYLLKLSNPFEKSLKKLLKKHPYKNEVIAELKTITEGLVQDPSFSKSTINASLEGISSKILSNSSSKFWKIRFMVGKGAAGQIRLMYLVNDLEKIVILIYIYDHKQFTKRPPEDLLKKIIEDAMGDFS